MLRKLFLIAGLTGALATLSGCEWTRNALNPTFSVDFSVPVTSSVSHPQLVYINGVRQGYILTPPPAGNLSHDFVVNIEVKDLDYWGSDGNQDRPFEAEIYVSLFDLTTGAQSREQRDTRARSDRANAFHFDEYDY